MLLQYYLALQSTTPILPCTTKYYSSTTPILLRTTNTTPVLTLFYKVLLKYYKVLLQYYLVLQSTTQVLQSTTPVLYLVLQSTTPEVLLCTTKYCSSTTCTTKYYSSTNLYYKVLLQYYPVLQSTTQVLLCTSPVLPCTTKYYSSTTCSTKYYSSTNLYYKVLLQYDPALQSTSPVLLCTTKYFRLIRITYETSFAMRGATKGSLQLQQILRLPRKMNFMIDLHRIWNFIYNARSNKRQPPTSANTAPATQNEFHDSWLICIAYETSFAMRGATKGSLQLQQILHLPRKMNLMIDLHRIWNVIYNAQSNSQHPPTSPKYCGLPRKMNLMIDLHRIWKRHLQCAEQQKAASNFSKYCTCHAKWISWLIRITYETSFTMRGATVNTLQPHQILPLPRKMTTQHLTEICWKQLKRHFQCATDPRMIRPWSEHDPTMIRPRKRKTEPAAPPRLLFALARSRF